MEREAYRKYQTPEKWEAGAIAFVTKIEPELFPARGKIEFAFPDIPEVRNAVEQFRKGLLVDCYSFSMVMRKLTGRLIEAKQVLKREMGNDDSTLFKST